MTVLFNACVYIVRKTSLYNAACTATLNFLSFSQTLVSRVLLGLASFIAALSGPILKAVLFFK